MNPNDKTADIYDKYTKPLKGDDVTNAELEIMRKLIPAGGSILDIGGGTGRHAVPLATEGNFVTVVESSPSMLHQLETKIADAALGDKVHIVNENALEFNPGEKRFDLVIMMWNAFNEIALTDGDAILLLKKCRDSLKDGGSILINIDDIQTFDPSNLKFETDVTVDDLTYHQEWEVINFDPATNTTTSKEIIKVVNPQGDIVRQENSEIKQRWWRLDQIQPLAEAYALQITQEKIPQNEEFYLVIHR